MSCKYLTQCYKQKTLHLHLKLEACFHCFSTTAEPSSGRMFFGDHAEGFEVSNFFGWRCVRQGKGVIMRGMTPHILQKVAQSNSQGV